MTDEPTVEERLSTAEERIEMLREAVVELQDAFNRLVEMAVQETAQPAPHQVGTRGPTRCQDPRSGNVGHLCIYGHNNPDQRLCNACVDELS